MHYVERVNEGVAQSGDPFASQRKVPTDVALHALALRHEPIEGVKDFSKSLSPEYAQLLKSRIGATLSRVAVASYIAADSGANVPYFGDLPDAERRDAAYHLTKRYKKIYKHAGRWTPGVSPLEVVRDNDPLPAFSAHSMRGVIAETTKIEQTRSERIRAFGRGVFRVAEQPHYAPLPYHDVALNYSFGRTQTSSERLLQISAIRQASTSDEEAFDELAAIRFEPGVANREIADAVAKQLCDQGVATEQIVQWEVAAALHEQHPGLYGFFDQAVHVLWPQGEQYPARQIAADTVKVMDSLGLYSPVDRVYHAIPSRARRTLERRGIRVDTEVLPAPERVL